MIRFAAMLVAMASSAALAQSATFTVRTLTPEAALKAAQAALAKCRAEGFQATVAVVDRSGVTLALIRDRFAAPHTVDTAQRKAQTAINFKMNTAALDRELQPGKASAGLRSQSHVVAVAGGLVVENRGAPVGAVGGSGAPRPPDD